jgi:bifunctional non-homologous end joining protein LigD
MAKLSRKGQGARRGPDRKDRALRSRARADVYRGEPSRSADAGPPAFIEPCISTTVAKVPPGDEWLHEFKWDGYRLMVHVDHGRVSLLTRNGFDWTERFPTIAKAAAELQVASAYIDGEAVVEERGVPDFRALRVALGEGRGDKAVLIAFDLLFLDGEDLRRTPLEERKRLLASILATAQRGSAIVYSEHAELGAFMMKQAEGLGLEGVVSKRRDRPYVSGPTRDWLKVKRVNRQEFVVAGYLQAKSRDDAVSSLVLGWNEEEGLVYKGRVGVGFDDRSAHEVWDALQPLRRKTAPFPAGTPPGGARDALWVEPALLAEVAYGHWTPGGLLRHAVFKGLREDKDAGEVRGPAEVASVDEPALPAKTPRERPKSPAPGSRLQEPEPGKPGRAGAKRSPTQVPPKAPPGRGVPRENILQLLPDAVVPSQEALAAYWTRVAEPALEHLARRPLKLVLHRRGTTYYHKGPLPPVPASVHQLRIEKREGGEGVRLWVDDVEGLLGLVDMGAVELHPWGATVDDIEHPDMLVFDLDAGPGVSYAFVRDTALSLREMLETEGFAPWPKLTGGKGVHLMVPITPDLDWDAAHGYCKDIAERLAATAAERYTTNAALEAREGRLFIDYLRNGRGTTAIGTYSPRVRRGFPIAAPVAWSDIERGVLPGAFTIKRQPSG